MTLDFETPDSNIGNTISVDPDTLTPEFSYIERALASSGGIRITLDTKAEATAMRHRIYRVMKRLKDKGMTSLSSISILLEENTLLLKKLNIVVEDL